MNEDEIAFEAKKEKYILDQISDNYFSELPEEALDTMVGAGSDTISTTFSLHALDNGGSLDFCEIKSYKRFRGDFRE